MITHASLARDIEDFLVFKRALGYSYQRGELMLISFQHFVAKHVDSHSRFALDKEIERWLQRAGERKPVTSGLELGVLRQLCLFRRRRNPNSFVPEHSMAPVVESKFAPYIFSVDEIRRILEEVRDHRHLTMSAAMLRTLILITYCTGLRLGEAVHLQMADVDLEQQILMVRESKGRSRIVPFRADLAREIQSYLVERRELFGVQDDNPADALFARWNGDALPINTASCAITRILRRIGIKPRRGRIGPRPYELRHAFAVHRLTDWYRSGVDI